MTDLSGSVTTHRELLFNMMGPLGLRQKDLADDVGVTPGLVSRFFNRSGQHQPLGAENAVKLFNAFDKQVGRIEQIKRGRDDLLNELELSRSRHTRQAADNLTPEQLKRIRGQLAAIANGSATGASRETGELVLVQPRGPLPVRALNYQDRSVDREVTVILDDKRAPANIVIGPINGGTSSLLNRVYGATRTIEQSERRMINLDTEFTEGEPIRQVDIFRVVLRALGMTADLVIGDVHEMKDAFRRWATQEWSDFSRIVVIIDGLDHVFKNAGSLADSMALINWLAGLRAEAARGDPPFENLMLFTAFTGQTWSAAHASPYGSQAQVLIAEKFNKHQITSLFSRFELEPDEKLVDDAMQLFHGHPFLTHLFVWDIYQGASAEAAMENALHLTGDYGGHWERMRNEIRFLVRNDFELIEILKAVVTKCKATVQDELPNRRLEMIWDNFARSLRTYGLIDGSLKDPALCRFYLSAIEHEL
ncbi:MAG: AAA-like domain-containing protein [Alphaproteobacteria bacterium]